MGRLIAIAAGSLVLAAPGCGGDGDDDTPGGARDPAPQAAASDEAKAEEQGASDETGGGDRGGGSGKPGITIRTADSQFGTVLFDEGERAIYLFDKEKSSVSACYGDCAAAWPPVLTDGDPQAAGAADAKLLGTTRRQDGSTQATYNGHPLYYYVDDPPGQVLCHNVSEFGGLWLVVDPRGDPVQ